MTLPIQHQVLSTLQPYAGVVVNSVMKGWSESQDVAMRSPWLMRRTRANVVWEGIVRNAISCFDGDPTVIVRRRYETYDFLVNETVLFRFKKGDSNGFSSNYPTQLAMAFHDHGKNLFGQPQIQRVDVVYRLNPLETKVSDVLVVARDGDQILWASSLIEFANVSNVVPLQIHESDSGDNVARRLIKPRNIVRAIGKKSNSK